MAPVAQPALREPHSGPPILRIQWRPSRICAAPACCMEGGLAGVLMSRERLRPLGLYRLHSAMSFCHLASSARLACHIIPQPPTLHLDRPTPLGALRLCLTGRPLGA